MISTVAQKLLAKIMWTTGCIRRGDFTLKSGAKSDLYIDCRRLLTAPLGAATTGNMMLTAVAASEPNYKSAVGGPGVGGALLVGAMAAMAAIAVDYSYPWTFFAVRLRSKDHGPADNLIAGSLEAGSKVALVDDVLTSGSSLLEAADIVRSLGSQVVVAHVIVDRHEGGHRALALAGIPVYSLLTKADLLAHDPALEKT
jgi:orotate phosphoribosyltransferase